MKVLKTLIKNFRILFRMKTSLIGIILGPLLIIALVGLAFNSSSSFQISVGYVALDNGSLTNEYVNVLQEQYSVIEFSNRSSCVNSLQHSLIHLCILFPEDFVIKNNKINNVTFVVDKSRTNIVYSVFNSINKRIGLKSEELSKGLTEELIKTLDLTSDDIDTDLGLLIRLKNSLSDSVSSLKKSKDSLDSLDLSSEKIDTSISSETNSLEAIVLSLTNKGHSVVKTGLPILADLRTAVSSNSSLVAEVDSLKSSLESLNTTCNSESEDSDKQIESIKSTMSSISKGVLSLNDKLDLANSKVGSELSVLKRLIDDFNQYIKDIDVIKQNLESSSQRISSVSVTSSDEIVNPITTNIETISSDNNKLIVLFPYLLVLIIMFVGLMMASTLVIVEKKSKAYFRVFTTPTRDSFFLWTTFLTAFLIVLFQTIIILLLMKFLFVDLMFSNLLVNSVILIITISIFVMIGMAVGYLFSSPQGANMASISIGAILLFISNMVFPLESVSVAFQKIAHFNPYVIASEMLRQSILFSVSFKELFFDLGILLIYSMIIVILIIFVQQLSKKSFFNNIPHILSKRKISDNSLVIKGKLISSEKDLIKLVHSLSEKEFSSLVAKSKFCKKFILNHLEDETLAKNIRKFTKQEFFDYFLNKNNVLISDLKSGLDKVRKKTRK